MSLEEQSVFLFWQEMEYWGTEELFISFCRSKRATRNARKKTTEKDWDQKSNDESTSSSSEESCLRRSWRSLTRGDLVSSRRRSGFEWETQPTACLSAKLIAISSVSMMLASIVAMCVHSISEFPNEDREVHDPMLEGLETACITWFTCELCHPAGCCSLPKEILEKSSEHKWTSSS